MAKGKFMGLSFAVCALLILFAVLLFVPMVKSAFPGIIQGFMNYSCDRNTTCPEGQFCQSNTCMPIAVTATNTVESN